MLELLLKQSKYDELESKFLVEGFRNGFDRGYRGPADRKLQSDNIPFTPGVGDKFEMWEKIIKEVKLQPFARPYSLEQLPYENFIQSPIGLVPKAGGQTRLIFHLSYEFKGKNGGSFNHWTPDELCLVKYNDLNHAIANSIRRKKGKLFYSKTDLKSAFRIFPGFPGHRRFLILKVQHPITGKWCYFINLCMPFGASISCANFQRFSNALKHIVEHRAGVRFSITNYLDDFLFISDMGPGANVLVSHFMDVCNMIKFPIFL